MRIIALLVVTFLGLKSCVSLPEEATRDTLSDNIPLWIIIGIGFIIYIIVIAVRGKKD